MVVALAYPWPQPKMRLRANSSSTVQNSPSNEHNRPFSLDRAKVSSGNAADSRCLPTRSFRAFQTD